MRKNQSLKCIETQTLSSWELHGTLSVTYKKLGGGYIQGLSFTDWVWWLRKWYQDHYASQSMHWSTRLSFAVHRSNKKQRWESRNEAILEFWCTVKHFNYLNHNLVTSVACLLFKRCFQLESKCTWEALLNRFFSFRRPSIFGEVWCFLDLTHLPMEEFLGCLVTVEMPGM